MRDFSDNEIAGAFLTTMPEVPAGVLERGWVVDYGWQICGRDWTHLVFFRRISHPDQGAVTLEFLGYLLEPYGSPSQGDEDHELPRRKYRVVRDDPPEGDFAYHDPEEGAPLARALPSCHGSIKPNGCVTFSFYETHVCSYDELVDAIALVTDIRDAAEDICEIER